MGIFLLGVLVVSFGVALVYYARDLIEMFGRMPRADNALGGTMQAYVLVGFIVMIVGFCIGFGIINLSGDMGNISIEKNV